MSIMFLSGLLPLIFAGAIVIAVIAAIVAKTRGRAPILLIVLMLILGGLMMMRFVVSTQSSRYGPGRNGPRYYYPRGGGYAPDMSQGDPGDAGASQTLSTAEADAMRQVIESIPETLPALPPPAPSLNLVIPTDPPIRFDQRPPATQPTTQPQSRGKLWLNDWDAFVNAAPPGTNYIRSDVTEPALTPAEARQLAVRSIADSVRSMVQSRIVVRIPGMKPMPPAQLDRQIAEAIESGSLIVDESLQRIERPYGTLWKQDMLVDASPARVDAMLPKVITRIQIDYANLHATQVRQYTTAAMLAGLGCVIVLLYVFLNFATRGYFVWRLRAAAVMGLIVALLAFFMVA